MSYMKEVNYCRNTWVKVKVVCNGVKQVSITPCSSTIGVNVD